MYPNYCSSTWKGVSGCKKKNLLSQMISLVRKPHVKRNQRRAITVQPGTRGVLCAPKNKKQSTMKSEDREKQN
jgi:hypothetical protein